MRRLIACCLTLAALGGVVLGQTFHLPRIINGQGLTTTFLFFNNGDAPSTVVVNFKNQDGDAFDIDVPGLTPVVAGSYMLNLDPGQTLITASDGQGALQTGTATVVSTGPLGVSAILSLFSGAVEAGVSSSDALSSFDIPVDSSGNFGTGLAVQNLSGSTTDLTFTLFDTAGAQQGAPVGRSLPGNGALAVFVGGPDGLFQGLSDFRGKLHVASSNDVAALNLRQELTSGVLTTLPVVPSNSSRTGFNLPQIANGGGIKTTFVLFGLGQAAGAQATLTREDGTPMSVGLSTGGNGSQFDFNVPANGAVFVETDNVGATITGAARVTSTAPIGVSAVFSILNGNTLLTEAGIGDSPPFSELTIPVVNEGSFNTGLALFNPAGVASDLELTFFNTNGSGQGLTVQAKIDPFSIAPLNRLARFLTELDESLDGINGMVAITASQPISALNLRQNTSPSTLTTLPAVEGVPPAPSTGGGGGDLLLPKVETVADLTSNQTLDLVLPAAFEISGTASLPGLGSSLQIVEAIRKSDSEIFPGVPNATTGQYRIPVPAGQFDVFFCYTAPFGGFPKLPPSLLRGLGVPLSSAFLEHSVEVTVNGDTTLNLNLPNAAMRTLTGSVTNLGALPPELQMSQGLGLVFTSTNSQASAVLALIQGGNYSANIPDGQYTASMIAGETADPDSAVVLFNIGQVTINGNASANFAVPTLIELSGTVTKASAGALPDGAFVLARDPTSPEATLARCFRARGGGLAIPEANGDYDMVLIRNRQYKINAELPVTSIGTSEEGNLFIPQMDPPSQTFSVDSVRDFAFPLPPAAVTLSGQVRDGNGDPVAGADVDIFCENLQGTANAFFITESKTDGSGNYSVSVLAGFNYRVEASIFPPAPGLP